LFFSPDSRSVVIVCPTDKFKVVTLWDIYGGRRIGKSLELNRNSFVRVAFGADGRPLVAALSQYDSELIVFDPSKAHQDVVPLEQGSKVAHVAFSPEGQYLAACYGVNGAPRGGVVVWDLKARSLAKSLTAPDGGHALSVDYSPDGRTLAAWCTSSRSRSIGLVWWDVKSGERIGGPIEHGTVDEQALWVEFSPDGRAIAAPYREPAGSIAIYDVHGGRRIRVLGVDEGRILRIGFSPNSNILAARYWNPRGPKGVVLWNAAYQAVEQ
jgi:WD40 repeat protein